jgi:hypothetical protein
MAPGRKGRKKAGSGGSPGKLRAVRSNGPGPPYVVRWHPEADAERESSWPAAEKVAMAHAVEKLGRRQSSQAI